MLSVCFWGCANSDDWQMPEINYHKAKATLTLKELRNLAKEDIQQYTENDILELYVGSSDEGGNFFKSISVQDKQGTIGASLLIDLNSTYTLIEPGRKVYVYLKDLYYQIEHDAMVIGDISKNKKGKEVVGRMNKTLFNSKVRTSEEKIDQKELIKTITIKELKNNKNLNVLVRIDSVQFDQKFFGKTFHDKANDKIQGTNYKIIDPTGDINFRTSRFAKFKDDIIPDKKGFIVGVLTKYNSNYQFMSRTLDDVQLTEDIPLKEKEPEKNENNIAEIKGGSNLIFNEKVLIDFDNYEKDQENMPELINASLQGKRYWRARQHKSNSYAEISAFKNKEKVTESFLMVPVKFKEGSAISFATKDAHYKGEVLNVYYVLEKDYKNHKNIDLSKFKEITTEFKISSGTTKGFAKEFTESGVYKLSGVAGKGFLVFRYLGDNKNITTTIQIDNIKID